MRKQTLLKNTVKAAAFTLSLCMCGCFCACTNQEGDTAVIQVEETTQETAGYTLAQVKKGTVISEVEINCSYNPKEKLSCYFTGEQKIIKEILVEKGDLVTKGQVLAKQDVDSLDEKIKEEQHLVEMAQLKLSQAQELKKIDLDILLQEYNYVDKEERDSETYQQNKKEITKKYDNQITDLSDQTTIHQLRMEEYEKEMEDGILRAPDDGVVTLSRSNMEGEYSKPEEAVVTIIRNNDLTFISDELDKAQYITQNQTYQVLVGKGESQQSVEVIPSDMSQWGEQMYFEIRVPNLKLETGTKGVIWIQLDQKDDVLYVPNTAVHQSGNKYYVYTTTAEGMRNIQYVTIGITGRENTEIKEGLTIDQFVITD